MFFEYVGIINTAYINNVSGKRYQGSRLHCMIQKKLFENFYIVILEATI